MRQATEADEFTSRLEALKLLVRNLPKAKRVKFIVPKVVRLHFRVTSFQDQVSPQL
jgi:hypothetical protein